MDRNIQRNGLINWLVLLALGVLGLIVADYAKSATGIVGATFIGLGFLVGAVSYFQMRLEYRERAEQFEYEELKKSKSPSGLFEGTEPDTFPARQARDQFERFGVPIFTALLMILEGLGVYFLWPWIGKAPAPDLGRVLVTLALYAAFALILFLLGKYSTGLAQMQRERLLRPGAAYLLLGAVVCTAACATEAAAWFQFPKVDFYVARGLCALLGLVGVETLLALIFEFYRPRVKGQERRLIYESHLIGLLSQPTGIIRTVAQALDYQFGFKVSETWFYRFLEKAFAWIVLVQLGVLFLSTTVVIVQPHEQALLEHFGRPETGRTVLGPGLHLKWPWPIDQVYPYSSLEVHTFTIGYPPSQEETNDRVLVWTVKHHPQPFYLIVASSEQLQTQSTNQSEGGQQAIPVNLLETSIPIQYQITNLTDWVYHYTDGQKALKEIATREVVRFMVGVDINYIMSSHRLAASEELRQRIQQRASGVGLGVKILQVGLEDIHPPQKVASAYEAVIGAFQEKEATILKAEGYRAQTLPNARAQATQVVDQARAYRVQQTAHAKALASQFTNQITAYQASPQVYVNREYLQMLSQSVTNARKYILATTNQNEMVIMDLQSKIGESLLNTPFATGTPTNSAASSP